MIKYTCKTVPVELLVRTVARHNETIFELQSEIFDAKTLDKFKIQIEPYYINFENNQSIKELNGFHSYSVITPNGGKHPMHKDNNY